jgi:hypothetical protein
MINAHRIHELVAGSLATEAQLPSALNPLVLRLRWHNMIDYHVRQAAWPKGLTRLHSARRSARLLVRRAGEGYVTLADSLSPAGVWHSSQPLARDTTIATLLKIGWRQHDVDDAMADADA